MEGEEEEEGGRGATLISHFLSFLVVVLKRKNDISPHSCNLCILYMFVRDDKGTFCSPDKNSSRMTGTAIDTYGLIEGETQVKITTRIVAKITEQMKGNGGTGDHSSLCFTA